MLWLVVRSRLPPAKCSNTMFSLGCCCRTRVGFGSTLGSELPFSPHFSFFINIFITFTVFSSWEYEPIWNKSAASLARDLKGCVIFFFSKHRVYKICHQTEHPHTLDNSSLWDHACRYRGHRIWMFRNKLLQNVFAFFRDIQRSQGDRRPQYS